jgi:hypothetical protein
MHRIAVGGRSRTMVVTVPDGDVTGGVAHPANKRSSRTVRLKNSRDASGTMRLARVVDHPPE